MDKSKSVPAQNVLERCVADCEKTVIIHALMRTHGNQTAAAMLLGTTKRSLTYKVNKYRIDCARYREDHREEL